MNIKAASWDFSDKSLSDLEVIIGAGRGTAIHLSVQHFNSYKFSFSLLIMAEGVGLMGGCAGKLHALQRQRYNYAVMYVSEHETENENETRREGLK